MPVVVSVAARTFLCGGAIQLRGCPFLYSDLSPPVRNLIALNPLVSWAPQYFVWGSYFGEGLWRPQGVLLSWAYLAALHACYGSL